MRVKIAVAAVGLALSYPALADYASVYQSGVDNYAGIEQISTGASAYVNQNGDRNRVGYSSEGYESPGIYQYLVNYGYSQVQQQGNDNQAWTYQYYGDNLGISIQQGGWRYDSGSQTYTDYGNAFNNYAYVYQYAYNGGNLSANVFQAGSYNSMQGQQQGSNNQMTVFQNGTGNTAYYLNQYGSGGDTNVMNISQTGNYNNVGYYYYYNSVQSGSGNEMNITQNGDNNLVYSASQYGTNNLLNISQTGVGHYAYASQYGTGNVARINQH